MKKDGPGVDRELNLTYEADRLPSVTIVRAVACAGNGCSLLNRTMRAARTEPRGGSVASELPVGPASRLGSSSKLPGSDETLVTSWLWD